MQDYLREFGFIGLFIVAAVVVPVSLLVISWLFSLAKVRPQKPSPVKRSTYECGMETIGGAWIRFNFRYYLFALLYVVFAVETVFLYPWAVHFKKLGFFALIEVLVFIAILLVGYVYAWRKRALEWS